MLIERVSYWAFELLENVCFVIYVICRKTRHFVSYAY